VEVIFESIFSTTLWKENTLSKRHNIIHLLGTLRKCLNGIKGVPPRYRTLHAPCTATMATLTVYVKVVAQ